MTAPAASWTAIQGAPIFTYSTNYLVEVKAGIIVDVEPSATNHAAETHATRTMLERVEQRFDLKPRRLIGDMVYGCAFMLSWLIESKGIAPHVPVGDKNERKDSTFTISDFIWDEKASEDRCPGGQVLRSEWRRFTNSRTSPRLTRSSIVPVRRTAKGVA